jgi:hypothetical protein
VVIALRSEVQVGGCGDSHDYAAELSADLGLP